MSVDQTPSSDPARGEATPQRDGAERMARPVQITLGVGLVIGALMLLAGVIIVLVKHEPRPNEPPPGIRVLIEGARKGEGVALLDLGLLVLVLTPLLRVVVLGIGWALERQWRFALVAFVVLILLSLSLVMGVH